ncbi:MAG: hypothetical protein LIO69_00860 [Oscillospiraceae bacterium]|nr:hypothetical protein [Oscillospiraceae bacterium]
MSSEQRRSAQERASVKRKLKREYKRKKRRERGSFHFIANLVMVLIVGAGLVSVISDRIEYNERKQELEELEEQALALEAENATYESILNEEDERTYMERIAIEELGYAYPDERRFYDTTRS